jgi:1-acyl-sn-glycerol-3-phosphate acyltransferase
MGKQELINGMVTGIYFRTVDIAVNRDSKMSAFRAFKAAEEKLDTGISMFMFPEGGIADDYPPDVQHFKEWSFQFGY